MDSTMELVIGIVFFLFSLAAPYIVIMGCIYYCCLQSPTASTPPTTSVVLSPPIANEMERDMIETPIQPSSDPQDNQPNNQQDCLV